jgi:hypothetical protein
MTGACGPYNLGGSATGGIRGSPPAGFVAAYRCVDLSCNHDENIINVILFFWVHLHPHVYSFTNASISRSASALLILTVDV